MRSKQDLRPQKGSSRQNRAISRIYEKEYLDFMQGNQESNRGHILCREEMGVELL
jgi:hypothetical protein